jgi:DNA-binding MarR family transcriptional regulator
MSSAPTRPDFVPMISLVDKTARALRTDMVRNAHARGFTQIQPAHNAVFATLPREGARAADMAARSGITRQSMGEVIRDMVGLGILETVPDPADARAKIVRFTDHGLGVAQRGYERIIELERILRGTFGDADVDATRRVLAGIIEMLGETPSSEPPPRG